MLDVYRIRSNMKMQRNYKAYPVKDIRLVYLETLAIRQFMRGTDPIKSTWVYPKLIL
jgi:hypothetical protein